MPGGRPRSIGKNKFDLDAVKLFGQFRATHETMAEYFGCSVRTIEREMSNEDSKYCRAYKKARSNLKMKLSEAQVHEALNGNATMLVWLGKQHLGQKDKQEQKIEHNFPKKISVEFVRAGGQQLLDERIKENRDK